VVSGYHDVIAALAHENVGYEDDPVQGVASRNGDGPFESNIGS